MTRVEPCETQERSSNQAPRVSGSTHTLGPPAMAFSRQLAESKIELAADWTSHTGWRICRQQLYQLDLKGSVNRHVFKIHILLALQFKYQSAFLLIIITVKTIPFLK